MSISVRDLQRQEEMHESRLAALENAMEDVKGKFNILEAQLALPRLMWMPSRGPLWPSNLISLRRKLGESCTSEIARLRRDLRTQDGKIYGVHKDVNNLAKAQPSDQVEKSDRNQRSCNASIKLLPETDANDGELLEATNGLLGSEEQGILVAAKQTRHSAGCVACAACHSIPRDGSLLCWAQLSPCAGCKHSVTWFGTTSLLHVVASELFYALRRRVML